MNGANLDFSSSRRKQRANRGYVEHVGVSARSGETDAQYSRRTSRIDYAEGVQRKSRLKSVAVMAALVLAVVGVGVGVGVNVYFGHSDSKLSIGDSSVSDVLVAPAEGEPYFALCAAELGTATASSDGSTDAYLLVRIDEANRQIALVSIPANQQVRLSDGESHALYEALDIGGGAELISAVSAFAGVDIAHYAHTNAEGIARIVDKLGGLNMTLTEEVDDPVAGTRYLQAGEQTLDAEAVVTLLRASNFSNGLEGRADNQANVMMQIATQVLASEGFSFASALSDMADFFETSWSSSDLMALSDVMRPLDTATVYVAMVPGHEAESSDGVSFIESTARWEVMVENLVAGRDPDAESAAVAGVDRANVTVEVRNGGGVTGAGAKMGELLTSSGYQLGEVGNTDDGATYPETLVVYKDEAYADAAAAIVSDTGAGRVVNGGDFYTFDANVLVVVGKDWMPVS